MRAATQLRRNAILFMRRNGSARENLTSLAYFLTIGALHEARVGRWTGLGADTSLRATVSALAWNLRDAASRHRWRLEADGPSIDRLDDTSWRGSSR